MNCESVRPLVRSFLDDLLDENDYQGIHRHLSECDRCHAYASSVGTLSYQLFELAQVTLPPDMVSAILFEFRKPGQAASEAIFPEAPSGPARPAPAWFYAGALIMIGAAMAALVWNTFETPRAERPSPPSYAAEYRALREGIDKIRALIDAPDGAPTSVRLGEVREVLQSLEEAVPAKER